MQSLMYTNYIETGQRKALVVIVIAFTAIISCYQSSHYPSNESDIKYDGLRGPVFVIFFSLFGLKLFA